MASSFRTFGTGSISLLAMEEADVQAAAARRVPLGFAPAAEPELEAQPERQKLGECSWTARDLTEEQR